MCLCVCVWLCLSQYLSGRFNYEGLVPHKQYFAVALLGMFSCARYVSRTHVVVVDVTRSQSRSNFEINISPSIFKLQHQSKAQNVANAHGYLYDISTSGITSGKKFVASSKWRPFWKFWNVKHSFNLISYMKRSSKIMPKMYFHDDDVIHGVTGWPQSRPSILLYKWNNNIFHDN